jgi:phospholipase D1/2
MTRKKNARRRTPRWAWVAAIGFAVAVLALTAVWNLTPLEDYADPAAIAHRLKALGRTPWMPVVVALVYVCASLLMFPNTVLCFAIIMALGPQLGAAYAFGGSLAAALAGYAIGRRGGKRVEKLGVGPFARASAELRHGGFMGVLALRLLPVAPFSATNILSGAARVRMLPYVTATLVGISPYILAFAAFGRQARRLLTDPTPADAAITVAIAVLASAALWWAQSLAAARAK